MKISKRQQLFSQAALTASLMGLVFVLFALPLVHPFFHAHHHHVHAGHQLCPFDHTPQAGPPAAAALKAGSQPCFICFFLKQFHPGPIAPPTRLKPHPGRPDSLSSTPLLSCLKFWNGWFSSRAPPSFKSILTTRHT